MRCPVCRAENTEGPGCRRCKADLSLLFALEARREYALRRGSLASAEEAHRLRPGRDSLRALAVAHLWRRDFARALACCRELA